jgi:23S rRNA (uracil1939-C5)-methyltransferase
MRNTLIIKAELPAYGGFIIARHNGKVVMIKGDVIPGEKVRVKIEEEKKDYLKASVLDIIEPSPDRINPACDYFGVCGGCHLQFLSYNKQVEQKEQILRDCLKRLAKTDKNLSVSLIPDNPWNYRYRAQLKIAHGKMGFYREKSREVVDIDRCPLLTEELNRHLKKAKGLIHGLHSREMHITTGDSAIVLIKIPAYAQFKKGYDEIASRCLNAGFAGLFIDAGDNRMFIYGKPYTALKLDNLRYTVSPASFLQSNWRLNQTLVRFIKEKLKPLPGKKILDLYSGAGNFSLPFANDAELTCVEENPYAVADGKRNIEINNIQSCRIIQSRAEDVYLEDDFDIVILDPPRPGVTNSALDKVFAIMPETIVYISCNPTTFARDLKKLLKKYDIESIRLVDLFPHTFHIESLAFLTKKA